MDRDSIFFTNESLYFPSESFRGKKMYCLSPCTSSLSSASSLLNFLTIVGEVSIINVILSQITPHCKKYPRRITPNTAGVQQKGYIPRTFLAFSVVIVNILSNSASLISPTFLATSTTYNGSLRWPRCGAGVT